MRTPPSQPPQPKARDGDREQSPTRAPLPTVASRCGGPRGFKKAFSTPNQRKEVAPSMTGGERRPR
jgi:hypothetical protein